MRQQDSNGRNLSFAYDVWGRKISQGDNWYGWGNASMQYDEAGRRTRFTWADGAYVSYNYFNDGQMSVIRDSSGNALVSFDYDNLGRRTSLWRANGTSTNYSYDPASRPAQIGLDLGGTVNDLSLNFSYNPAGDISSRASSNDAYAWNGYLSVNRGYSVNGLNQLTSAGSVGLGYDGRGNLNNSGGTSYSYTTSNQLAVAQGNNGLAYDPLGRLFNGVIDPGVNTTLLYDGAEVVTESDQNSGALLRRYVYGPGSDEPLIWWEGASFGDRRWLHADERGSIVAVTNDSGSAIAINAYDDYGIPKDGNLGRFQYTGQKWLPTVGLYDYKARFYSPTLGRFMQTDPIGYGDGMNMYAYAGNDPVNGRDPSGLRDCRSSQGRYDPDADSDDCGPNDEDDDSIYLGGVTVTDTALDGGSSWSGGSLTSGGTSFSGGSKRSSPQNNKGRDCSGFQKLAEKFGDAAGDISAGTFDAALYGEIGGKGLTKFGTGRVARFGTFVAGKSVAGNLAAASTISGSLSLIGYAASGQSATAIYNKAVGAVVDHTLGKFDGPLGKWVADQVTSDAQASFDSQRCAQ